MTTTTNATSILCLVSGAVIIKNLSESSIAAINTAIDAGDIINHGNGYCFWGQYKKAGRWSNEAKERRAHNVRALQAAGLYWPGNKNKSGADCHIRSTSQRNAPTKAPTSSIPAPIGGSATTNFNAPPLTDKAATTPDMAAIIAAVMAAMGQPTPTPTPPSAPTPIGSTIPPKGSLEGIGGPMSGSEHGAVTTYPGPTQAELAARGGHGKYYARIGAKGLNGTVDPMAKAAWTAARQCKATTNGVVAAEVPPKPQPIVSNVDASTMPVRDDDVQIVPFDGALLGVWKNSGQPLTYQRTITMRTLDPITGKVRTVRMIDDGSEV